MSDVDEVTRVHLHRADYPATLRLLEDLRGGRSHEDWSLIGFESTDTGAWVDWDQLAGSWLSSTELAVVQIARGCKVLEWAGGPAPRLRGSVIDTVLSVCGAPVRLERERDGSYSTTAAVGA